MSEWREKFEAEIARAESARAKGNEGQARVCARRAAGIAAREYCARLGLPVHTPSAYEVLKLLAVQARLPANIKQAVNLLTLRVDEEFRLPVDVDLIAEAHEIETLLN